MKRVLYVRVAEPHAEFMARTLALARGIDAGAETEPLFEVGFARAEEMLSVFTPKRWELIQRLREWGPLPVAELARRLGRNYKNVHGDVERLAEWLAVERDEQGRVFVPYSEIVVDMRLPDQAAA